MACALHESELTQSDCSGWVVMGNQSMRAPRAEAIPSAERKSALALPLASSSLTLRQRASGAQGTLASQALRLFDDAPPRALLSIGSECPCSVSRPSTSNLSKQRGKSASARAATSCILGA
eukprot:scaffold111843_cov32-Tisochrysis_lutea.AAC.2